MVDMLSKKKKMNDQNSFKWKNIKWILLEIWTTHILMIRNFKHPKINEPTKQMKAQ